MSYKIALASSNGSDINESFGAAQYFLIYEVSEDGYKKLEERAAVTTQELSGQSSAVSLESGKSLSHVDSLGNDKVSGCAASSGCGENSACGAGTEAASDCGVASGCGSGPGCGGSHAVSEKVELIADCRCVVCQKIGFNVQKQLERKAISAFDVNCTVEEALEKISFYFNRIDKHQSLRGLRSDR